METNKNISDTLIRWYQINKRDLPWRNTNDPYKIWISEIILQQTRVVQGLDYYNRFIDRFSDIESLAQANEEEVLKYWEGLGYYSRARNLHYTAKTIIHQYKGKFPNDYKTLLTMKGIGEYTAAAIASFAWNLPYPTIDGNVFRVLSRLFAIKEPIDSQKGKNYFTRIAAELICKKQPSLFNQAIMEFGALQCTPSSPNCIACPFISNCLAYAKKTVTEFPVKTHKTKTKDVYINYFHIFDQEHLLLYKREHNGIWKNLYEFPAIESDSHLEFDLLVKAPKFQLWFPEKHTLTFKCVIEKQKHVLTHRTLYVSFFQVYIKDGITSSFNFKKIKTEDIEQYPVHRLMLDYIHKNLNI